MRGDGGLRWGIWGGDGGGGLACENGTKRKTAQFLAALLGKKKAPKFLPQLLATWPNCFLGSVRILTR